MSQCGTRNFPGIFGILEYFSMALVIYLDISGFTFAQENISKKTKKETILFYLGRARRPDPVQPGPAVDSNRPAKPSPLPLPLPRGPRPSSWSVPSRSRRIPAALQPRTPLHLGPHAKASLGLFKGRRRSLPPFPKP
jgi:hypothetical protein